MSRIIEGSLEILRPIEAVMLEEEWDDDEDPSTSAAAAAAQRTISTTTTRAMISTRTIPMIRS